MKRILSTALILFLILCIPIEPILALTAYDSTVQPPAAQVAKAVVAVKSVKLDKNNLNMRIGKTATLKATVSPRKATGKKLSWTSSDESVATVSSSGKVTPLMVGLTTITAETANGMSASCAVTVKQRNPSGVKLSPRSKSLYPGDALTLTATIAPNDADQAITWSSSKKSVATVSQGGEVQALKVGTATITAKTVNGKKATCKITVKKRPPLPLDANDMKFMLWGREYTFPITEDQVPLIYDVTRTYTEDYIDVNDAFMYEMKRDGTTVKIMYDNYKWNGGIRPFEHVEMSGSSVVSYRGIKKGDSASKVRSLYGKPHNIFTNAYEYICDFGDHYFMYFIRIKNGKVTGFMVSMVA